MNAHRWGEMHFFPLPDTITDAPHFVVGDRIGRVLVPEITICWHRENRWPKGLTTLKAEIRSTGFKCPSCGASVLSHPKLVLPGEIYLCRCLLYGRSRSFPRPVSAEVWRRLQAIYAEAKQHAAEFPLLPATDEIFTKN
jgi:hypothetical protein